MSPQPKLRRPNLSYVAPTPELCRPNIEVVSPQLNLFDNLLERHRSLQDLSID